MGSIWDVCYLAITTEPQTHLIRFFTLYNICDTLNRINEKKIFLLTKMRAERLATRSWTVGDVLFERLSSSRISLLSMLWAHYVCEMGICLYLLVVFFPISFVYFNFSQIYFAPFSRSKENHFYYYCRTKWK